MPRSTPQRKSSNPKLRRPLGRPRLEDVSAIDEKLVTIALREFQQHGYGATSMNAIARAAHVSKTTLYSRFPSKESLFRAIMHEQIKQLGRARVLQLLEDCDDLAAGLEAYANYMLDLSLKGGLLKVNRLIYSESHRFPELGAAAAQRSRLGICEIAAFIESCAMKDNIPCQDAESVAEAFICMTRGWYADAMLRNRTVSRSEREQWVHRAVHVLVSSRNAW
jgi:TetR/AcrR family transcriptional repressor of mexJK operon